MIHQSLSPVLPVNNGIPTNNANGGIVNNNNIPFLISLSGFTSNAVQNNGNNNNIIRQISGFPVLNAPISLRHHPPEAHVGTMTVYDDELTEGHDLGSGLVGKAQGFYKSSSEDGMSQTMAFTVMFKDGSYADSLSFFGDLNCFSKLAWIFSGFASLNDHVDHRTEEFSKLAENTNRFGRWLELEKRQPSLKEFECRCYSSTLRKRALTMNLKMYGLFDSSYRNEERSSGLGDGAAGGGWLTAAVAVQKSC